jgi:hypothetical protein
MREGATSLPVVVENGLDVELVITSAGFATTAVAPEQNASQSPWQFIIHHHKRIARIRIDDPSQDGDSLFYVAQLNVGSECGVR